MVLRVYADVNSQGWLGRGGPDDLPAGTVYWCLTVNGEPLELVAQNLGLPDGFPIVIYYSDEDEAFEWDGSLWHRPTGQAPAPQWIAVADDTTFRRLR